MSKTVEELQAEVDELRAQLDEKKEPRKTCCFWLPVSLVNKFKLALAKRGLQQSHVVGGLIRSWLADMKEL